MNMVLPMVSLSHLPKWLAARPRGPHARPAQSAHCRGGARN